MSLGHHRFAIIIPFLLGAAACGRVGFDDPESTSGTLLGDPTDCGPAPGAPAVICADGSIGGFTGQCLCDRDGHCAWEFRDCPGTTGDCAPDECGPQPGLPALTCDDGSVGGFTGQCLRADDGTCHWEIRECPPVDACDAWECGPPLGAPAYLCEDGSVGGNTGTCLRAGDGACHWELRDCP